MSYMIFFVFINFPSNWVIDVKGIKNGVVLGAFLTFVGCTIRCFVNVHFAFVIIGQVICAIAQPFLLNAPMKIASRWYMPKNVMNVNYIEITCNGYTISGQYYWYCSRICSPFTICLRYGLEYKGTFLSVTFSGGNYIGCCCYLDNCLL